MRCRQATRSPVGCRSQGNNELCVHARIHVLLGEWGGCFRASLPCEVCPCSMRMPVIHSQPCGICPQGMQDMPAACPQPHWAMQVAVTQAPAGAGLSRELLGIGTTECVTKLLGQGLAN